MRNGLTIHQVANGYVVSETGGANYNLAGQPTMWVFASLRECTDFVTGHFNAPQDQSSQQYGILGGGGAIGTGAQLLRDSQLQQANEKYRG